MIPSLGSRILVVVGHPDDEVLGCGGTIAKWSTQGHSIDILLPLRRTDPKAKGCWDSLCASFQKSCAIMGGRPLLAEEYLDEAGAINNMRALHDLILPHVEQADIILTHSPMDVHQAHRAVSRAVEIATRPFRRRKTVLFFETSSSTDQGYMPAFAPNVWIELTNDDISKKCEAIKHYPSERAPGRSPEHLRMKAAVRGAEAGLDFAEVFTL